MTQAWHVVVAKLRMEIDMDGADHSQGLYRVQIVNVVAFWCSTRSATSLKSASMRWYRSVSTLCVLSVVFGRALPQTLQKVREVSGG